MNGSGTIHVLKRDNSTEPLAPAKLRLCLWRGLSGSGGRFEQAQWLTDAIAAHLRRAGQPTISSGALFEMAVNALRATGHRSAAAAVEAHHQWRQRARRSLAVRNELGLATAWDRGWLTDTLADRWALSRPTARALSGILEDDLLGSIDELPERALLDRADELIEQFGLAPWCLLASAPTGRLQA